MREFEKYFSFESILDDLIRRRVKGQDVGELLPARKAWSRLDVRSRQKLAPVAARRLSIRRTVMRCLRDGSIAEHAWGRLLLEFVKNIRASVLTGTVAFETPRMIDIVKGNVDGKRVYRTVASFDRLADRVVLNCVTAYVRDVLEGVLGENCYSFRKDSKMNHQSAVIKLQEWRRDHAHGKMFVAECDIKKFFDNISHSVVRKCWSKIGFAAEANSVLEAYLSVYSSSSQERRGLPQGGSFSTVLANMVMCAADDAVGRMGDGNLFYARFCDDVIFAHSDEAVCSEVMARYQKELVDLDLPIHPVEDFMYKPAGGESTDYYGIKSKGPFLWAEPKVGE